MVDTFNLYISAADDLKPERDLLSRIVTEIPVTLGWQINFSPYGKKTLVEKFVIEANLHILILGGDIRAPIGYEWHISRNLYRNPKLFIKEGIARTPAAADFQRSLSYIDQWQPFQSLSKFRKVALSYISQYIIDQANFFELRSDENDRLSEFLKNIDEEQPEDVDIARGIVGEDSIILSRERYIPRNGVLIHPPEESGNVDSD